MAPSPDVSETYALNFNAWTMLTFWHEIATNYQATYDYKLNLVDFTPYGQSVTWTRVDNGAAFSVNTVAFHDLKVATIMTRVRENAKTCSWSAYNMATGAQTMTPVCAYNTNSEYATDYQDPVWKFDGGQQLINNVNLGSIANFYGQGTWYSM